MALAPTVPQPRSRSYQMMFAIITPGSDRRCVRRARAILGGYLLFIAAWSLLDLRSARPLGVGGRVPGRLRPRRDRLRRWNGRSHQCRRGRARLRPVHGQTHRLPESEFTPHNVPMVLLGAGDPLVRLVRVQRGKRPRCRWPRIVSVHRHADRRRGRHARVARSLEKLRHGKATAVGGGDGGGRRARCHHARRRVRGADACPADRPDRWPRLLRAVEAQAAPRVRRFPRRRRCAHGRRIRRRLLTGVFASLVVNPAGAEGGIAQVGRQGAAAFIAAGFAFLGTLLILKVVDPLVGIRLGPEARGRRDRPRGARRAGVHLGLAEHDAARAVGAVGGRPRCAPRAARTGSDRAGDREPSAGVGARGPPLTSPAGSRVRAAPRALVHQSATSSRPSPARVRVSRGTPSVAGSASARGTRVLGGIERESAMPAWWASWPAPTARRRLRRWRSPSRPCGGASPRLGGGRRGVERRGRPAAPDPEVPARATPSPIHDRPRLGRTRATDRPGRPPDRADDRRAGVPPGSR